MPHMYCTLKKEVVAVIVHPIHTGHEEIPS